VQQDPSEPSWAPFRYDEPGGRGGRQHWGGRDRHGWHADGDWRGPGVWGGRAARLRNRGDGQPLRRDPQDRLLGGVAAGIAAWRGFSPTTVRIVLTVVALFSQGWAIPLYCAAWLLIPTRGSDTSIGSRARHDSGGIALAVGLGSLLCVILLLAGVLNNGVIATYGWPQVVSLVCLTLIWRNAPDDEQAAMRHLVEPLESLSSGGRRIRRLTVIRLLVAAMLLAGGLGWLVTSQEKLSYLVAPVGGVVLVAGGLVLLLGPWWLRIARDLMLERQARARAEERADMAARVHDSVLQTLALIQRRSGDPQQVIQLARAQERELRSWLFEGRAPGEADATSFADGIRQIQRDVEARHGVPVEVVTVGDCPLDDDIGALLAAAREATVNAAKWSGANVISLYAEVEPDTVEVAVRDRGKGFDPDAVPGDRKGLAESIHGRMSRHGGSATVNSAPGEGTKVTLRLPRTEASGGSGASGTAGGTDGSATVPGKGRRR
jgi:signal transduction histidine kinase/phage shock protein PspC (stress-responsive transcriptional regulator)